MKLFEIISKILVISSILITVFYSNSKYIWNKFKKILTQINLILSEIFRWMCASMRRVSRSVRRNDMLNKYYKSTISDKNVTNVHYRSSKIFNFQICHFGNFLEAEGKNLNNFSRK